MTLDNLGLATLKLLKEIKRTPEGCKMLELKMQELKGTKHE